MSDLIQVNCPHCERAIRVPGSGAGRIAICPLCNQRFQVPDFSAASPPVPGPGGAAVQAGAADAASSAPPASPAPPSPPQAGTFRCSRCGQEMRTDPSLHGRRMACPTCGWQFVLNGAAAGPSRPDAIAGNPYSELAAASQQAHTAHQYPYNPYAGGYQPPAVNAPGAVAAMIWGIVGLVICTPAGIVGIFVGNSARKLIRANPGRYAGDGYALTGVILGYICLGLTVLTGLMILAMFSMNFG